MQSRKTAYMMPHDLVASNGVFADCSQLNTLPLLPLRMRTYGGLVCPFWPTVETYWCKMASSVEAGPTTYVDTKTLILSQTLCFPPFFPLSGRHDSSVVRTVASLPTEGQKEFACSHCVHVGYRRFLYFPFPPSKPLVLGLILLVGLL